MDAKNSCGCGGEEAEKSCCGNESEKTSHSCCGQTASEGTSSCCGQSTTAVTETSSFLTWRDTLGDLLARLGWRRDRHTVIPGLYRLGSPGPDAPVLVTANYHLTFNALRKELGGRDLWILALDTKGINVWCAAGKGTFSTGEIIERIESTGLAGLSNRKLLILPQLGAPGVAAHLVSQDTGFRVVYGPVRASDLPEYLDNGMVKNDGMRKVKFGLRDRLVLVPLELVQAMKVLLPFLAVLAVAGVVFPAQFGRQAWLEGVSLTGAVIAGAAIFPLLLPFLPFRPFTVKGAQIGIIVSAALALLFGLRPAEALAAGLVVTVLTSFVAVNFTGSTTFTTLSGVKKELGIALPILAVGFAAGIALKVLCFLKVV